MPRLTSSDAMLATGLLATHADIQRLCRVMADWWRGDSLATIAAARGISRQRVHAMLARVACTGRLRRKKQNAPKDMPRCATAAHVEDALRCLLHPLAWRLTPRQRCALAWRAQGLTTVNAAHRMGTTGQGVRYFLLRARERLERLSGEPVEKGSWSPVADTPNRAQPMDLSAFDLTELEDILAKAVPAAPRTQPDAKA